MNDAAAPVLMMLAFLVPLPLSAAVLLPGTTGAAARALAPWGPLPALALALPLVPAAPHGMLDLPWLLLGSRFGLDETARLFLLFTSFVWLIAGWYARGYLHADSRRPRFWAFFLATQAGNLGLCLAQDAATFYFFFTLMTFAAYGLVTHAGTVEAFRAGRVYLVMAVLGEAALVAGILLAVHAAGGHLFRALAATPQAGVTVALLLAGFGVKAGLPLLHLWLPLAHPVAPVPASAVLSGVMLKAGVLGWIRFLPIGVGTMPEAGTLLMCSGVLAMFFGVAVGLTQSNMKVLLAYSSISQMGFIALGVGAGLAAPWLWPALLPAVTLYALHHALAKSALFLGSGVARSFPGSGLVLAGLALPALALAGMPFSSGALAKAELKHALAGLPPPWPGALAWLLPLAAMGTALLLVRFMLLAARRSGAEEHRGMVVPWAVLLLAVAAANWWLAAPESTAREMQAKVLLAASWPVGAALLVAWLAALLARRRGWRVPQIPPGDLLLPLEQAFIRMRQALVRLRPIQRKPVLSRAVSKIRARLARMLRPLDESA